MTVEVETEVTIRVYDVTVDGASNLEFSADVDHDGDLRIEVSEDSMVDYFKKAYDKGTLCEMFDIDAEDI